LHDRQFDKDGRHAPELDDPVEFARPDLEREHRKGVPEVVLAQGKRPEDVIAIARRFVNEAGRVIISRVDESLVTRLRTEFAEEAVTEYQPSRTVVVRRQGYQVRLTGGRVGVITAGTSDMPAAEEARIVAQEMGCETHAVFDVGVAGIHRLFGPLQSLLKEAQVDVLVVAAGMDGVLPSVVSGLVDVPVIGLPTPVGYGAGGRGLGALITMLQTCSPGLTVVNIDNGVGAGASAALIANRIARARASRG
jgi:pyridinium-3,5-biscarboxylic acid mononucleotide synthase